MYTPTCDKLSSSDTTIQPVPSHCPKIKLPARGFEKLRQNHHQCLAFK